MFLSKIMETFIQGLRSEGFRIARSANEYDGYGVENVVCEKGAKHLRILLRYDECVRLRFQMDVVVVGYGEFHYSAPDQESIISPDSIEKIRLGLVG